jgi:hypothetical protein
MYYDKSNLDEALRVFLQAFDVQGYSEYKTGLFQLGGQIFEAKNQKERACRLYALAALARHENNWGIPETLQQSLKSCNSALTGVKAVDFYRHVNKDLKPVKETGHTTDQSKQDVYHGTGKVTRILHEGSNGDGFITDEYGKSVYFRFSNCRFNTELVKEQMHVGFAARESDRGGRKVYSAIKVFKIVD